MLRTVKTSDVVTQMLATPGWMQAYQQMSPGPFHGLVRSLQLEGVNVYEERMNTRVEQHFVAPERALVFSFDACEQSLYVLNENSQNTWVTPPNYHEVAVVFSQEYLQEQGIAPDHLSGVLFSPLNSLQGRIFQGWLSKTLDKMNGVEVFDDRFAKQLLEDCLFVVDCSSSLLDAGARSQRHVERQLVRRIFEFVGDHPDVAIRAPQLADAIGVSLRHLQRTFQAYMGLSPGQWLRLRNFNAAYRDLLRADASSTTVTDVAMCWSFWHLGRFSASYRALFGEYPSQTLQRRG